MTDYREISQQYAQGAIKAVILLNSGALIASLSQLDSKLILVSPEVFANCVLAWLVGTTFGVSVWIVAFASTRQVDRVQRHETATYDKANFWMWLAVAIWFLSLGLFTFGGFQIIYPILNT